MTIIRLLGGDRKAIEKASGGRLDKIIDPKPSVSAIVAMVLDRFDVLFLPSAPLKIFLDGLTSWSG